LISAGSFTDTPADLAISDVVGLKSDFSDLNSKFSLNSSSGKITSSVPLLAAILGKADSKYVFSSTPLGL